MDFQRYKAEDLIELGTRILTRPQFGFKETQARATATVLVEADLRGDPDHGIAGGDKLDEIFTKVQDDPDILGFKRICNPGDLIKSGKPGDFVKDDQPYPTLITVDACGLLGHAVALEILPEVISTAKRFGCAKAYIRNSTHFGNCGIYSEWIAENDLAARVSCTSPPYVKPFIELQGDPSADGHRYDGVQKRFGTNPLAWSIPYDEGIITIDMATSQRAVSPAVNTANHNARILGIRLRTDGPARIGRDRKTALLKEVHLDLARIDDESRLHSELSRFGYRTPLSLKRVERGLLKGPNGEDIHYPLAFDDVFKKQFWVSPLGGTMFGYKGFGLNMLVELDNVCGGGSPDLIRRLDAQGKPETPERVSQTIEAYAIDMLHPLAEAKKRIGDSVRTTRQCGNQRMFLPGEKEQRLRREYLAAGIPMAAGRIANLEAIAGKVGVAFTLKPIGGI